MRTMFLPPHEELRNCYFPNVRVKKRTRSAVALRNVSENVRVEILNN